MAAPATEGGGGTMLVAEELTMPPGAPRLVAELLFPPTLGGGGTTSVVPINLPSRLLMKPPPATCAGGGITAFEGSGKPPLASECRSREISVDGGGAITDGAGRLSLGSRTDSRSGADRLSPNTWNTRSSNWRGSYSHSLSVSPCSSASTLAIAGDSPALARRLR